MALKKSELYSSLWSSCDELRGGMDASQYKDYVLVLLFIKYVSDKYAGVPYAPITIPDGASFSDMVALKGKSDIGDQINKRVIAPLADANKLSDMPDFNDATKLGTGREMVDRLTNLIAIFENKALDFSKNRADGDDILGDAYEYLMRHFATESGKSKGQFYTPAEVSRIIAQIIGIHDAKTSASTTVYDPTCGSGSLLLKVGDEAANRCHAQRAGEGRRHQRPCSDEHDPAQQSDRADRAGQHAGGPQVQGRRNTQDLRLRRRQSAFLGQAVEYGAGPAERRLLNASNPSARRQPSRATTPTCYISFGPSKAPAKAPAFYHTACCSGATPRRTFAAISCAKATSRASSACPPTSSTAPVSPLVIVVIDKEDARSRKGIFMIDASGGFMKDGPKNRLRSMDIHKIVDVFNKSLDIPKYARMVSSAEIEQNEFNLNLPRYIDSQMSEDIQDIAGHLQGGIPTSDVDSLKRYWAVCPDLRHSLFKENRPGYLDLAVEKSAIKSTIYEHHEFASFIADMNAHFAVWRESNSGMLKTLQAGCRPKEIIAQLSEGLLTHYADKPLIDPYDIYQHLMDFWAETMQDDCYLIATDGWKAETYRVIETDKKGKKKDRGWICDLVPKTLVVARYFFEKQAAIDRLVIDLDSVTARLAEMEEEHGGEDGAFPERDKVNKAYVTERLKEIKADKDAEDEAAALNDWLKLNTDEADLKKRLKEAEAALDAQAYAQYPKLNESETKTLVVDDKWLATLDAAIHGEMDRVSQQLTQRVKELAERYETPMPQMVDRVAELEAKVNCHLEKMGSHGSEARLQADRGGSDSGGLGC